MACKWLLRLLTGGSFRDWTVLLAPLLEALLWPLVSWVLLAPQRRPRTATRTAPCDHGDPA